MPYDTVWVLAVESYVTVPPHVLPVDNGAEEVFCVLIVPLLVTVVVTPNVYVAMSKMLEPVVKVVATILLLAVSVPAVLLKVKVL